VSSKNNENKLKMAEPVSYLCAPLLFLFFNYLVNRENIDNREIPPTLKENYN